MQRSLNRRRSWLAALILGATAIVAPTVAPTPAGAVTAPLLTEDGIGIRVDEWAIQGPALEAIETALQPTVDDLVQDGAVDAQIMDDPDHVISDSNLELAFDILSPSSPSRPYGALQFNATIEDIWIEYYRYGSWWQPECWIWITPADSTISVTANVDPTNLPATAPIEVQPASAYWDDDPTIDTNNWLCNGYLINEWWDGFIDSFSGDDPDSTASRVEDQIDAMSQDLVDQVWEDNVSPVLDSLGNFGITVSDLHTDAYGLIIKADVDSSAGILVPGFTGNPVNVTNAQDSGADSNVDTLLANYEEVIVSIHPNVANQFLYALNSKLATAMGQPGLDGPTIENLLLPPAVHGNYPDGSWVVRASSGGAANAQYVTPDATTGAPKVQAPNLTLQFRNGSTTVATFVGPLTGVNLITEVRSGSTNWGPAYNASNAALSTVTRTQANADAAQISPQSTSQILPYAKFVMEEYSDDILVEFVSLAPIELYDLSLSLCTTCGRYSGDERYTESFRVN